MPRLTREQSQMKTRELLLSAARTTFARDGYGGASIDRIAEEAGFSKGAVYANFANKEELFLEVMESQSLADLPDLLTAISQAADQQAAIECLAAWADARAIDGNWAFLVLEHVRHARQSKTLGDRQEKLFRGSWKTLGDAIAVKLDIRSEQADAESLGALVFELAFAPAMSFTKGPKAGKLVRIALTGILAAALGRQ